MIMNSDLFCDEEIVRKAIVPPFDRMVVDRDAEYTIEATKVKLDANGGISAIGKGASPVSGITGSINHVSKLGSL